MEHITHEYSAYIWSKERQKYIYLHPITRNTLEACIEAVKLKREADSKYMYRNCDWNRIEYRYRRVITTEWEAVHWEVK